jgi:hypothetical protein
MSHLSADLMERARDLVALYPEPRSALIPLCHLAQEQDGWLRPEAMSEIADLVGVTPAEVRGTATFYDMLHTEPVGTYVVSVCTNIACLLGGAQVHRTVGLKADKDTIVAERAAMADAQAKRAANAKAEADQADATKAKAEAPAEHKAEAPAEPKAEAPAEPATVAGPAPTTVSPPAEGPPPEKPEPTSTGGAA